MDPDSYLLMSGIQHFCFCRRQWALIHLEQQWALIHLEQQWAENLRTAEGHLLHERCHDEALHEKRGGLLTVRGLWKRVVQCSLIYGILSPKAELWCEGTANRKSPAASHLSVLLKRAGCAFTDSAPCINTARSFRELYPIVQMLPENSLYFMAHLLSPSSRRAWVEIMR